MNNSSPQSSATPDLFEKIPSGEMDLTAHEDAALHCSVLMNEMFALYPARTTQDTEARIRALHSLTNLFHKEESLDRDTRALAGILLERVALDAVIPLKVKVGLLSSLRSRYPGNPYVDLIGIRMLKEQPDDLDARESISAACPELTAQMSIDDLRAARRVKVEQAVETRPLVIRLGQPRSNL